MPTYRHPVTPGWAPNDALRRDPTVAEGRARLWDMTAAQRVAAMHRGELTLDQLAGWSATRPDEVPLLNGEFAWITLTTPEVAD